MSTPVAIITGAGRGIGRAIALRFARSGAQTVVAARNAAELDETRSLIESDAGRCLAVPTDVCLVDEVDAMVETARKRFGRIDVLVNNAGIAPNCALVDLEPALFRALMAVNVDAIYFACRAVWPVMRDQGGGAVVNISSIASADAFPGFAAYGASKAWVNAWTRAIAEEGRPHNIRVFAVAPGAVETRMLRDVFPDFPAHQTLDPQDVANVVYALTQADCATASGQTVFIRK